MNICLQQTSKKKNEGREPLVSWSLWWRTCSSGGRPGSRTTACCFCVWWGSAPRPCCLLWGTSLATWCHYVMTLTRKQKGPIEWLCFCLCWSSTGGDGHLDGVAEAPHGSTLRRRYQVYEGRNFGQRSHALATGLLKGGTGQYPTQLQHLNNTAILWSITDVLGKFLDLYNAVQNTANRWGSYLKGCFCTGHSYCIETVLTWLQP